MNEKRRRSIAMKRILAAFGLAAVVATPAAAQNFGSSELIAAAKKEGRLVFYTANFAEVEQEVIKAFNKRFPEIKVEMVRAPGGQLITRIKTEAAAGKLAADVVNHSDRGLMLDIENLFMDYAPPNAADYLPDVLVSPKFWPQATLGWAIAYNSAIVKDPPKSWMDLTKPEYKGKQIGQTIAPSGGTTWTRVMFERQVLGEDYWKRQAATEVVLFPSGAPAADALVRGEVSIVPSLYNIVFQKQRDGAPVEIIFAPEGMPINPYAAGVPTTAKSPNAAKLFLNWCLSSEGQAFMIKEQGNLTSLKVPPLLAKGYDPNKVKSWVPNFKQYQELRSAWIEDWNRAYNYRQ
jgi:iron(III) transport system substrate-binding protein